MDLGDKITSYRFLICDRDTKFTSVFDEIFAGEGVTVARDSAAEAAGQLLCRAVDAHRPVRVHRPDADLRRTAPARSARTVRRPPPAPVPVQRRKVLGGMINEYYRAA
jgi:hypothetical protein